MEKIKFKELPIVVQITSILVAVFVSTWVCVFLSGIIYSFFA